MTEKEMKLLHERMKKEDPKLLALMEKCFDAGVISGKEQAQRTWVGLTDEEIYSVLENLQVMHHRPPTTDSRIVFARAIEAKLKEKNT